MSAATASPRLGYVGMEVTKRPPFIVLAVDYRIDVQGQPSRYGNLDEIDPRLFWNESFVFSSC